MKYMVWTGTQLVPIGGVPAGPGPDPEDPKVPPPAVISLAATSPSPTQLTITWLAPTDPNAGGTITHYQVDLNGADYNWSLPSPGISIGDLEPDTQYTVTVRPVNNYGLVGPSASVEVWTQVETPYDADLGTIGNRPDLTVRPDETNTGPRQSTTQTMTGPQALAAALAAPVEADGKRYLRRVRIVSNMTLDKASHSGLVFEDCIIEGGTAPYALKAFLFAGVQPAVWVEFRYCTITGGASATVAGGYVRLLRCNVNRGNDVVKPFYGMEMYACYLHSTWATPGAHCDIVQITSGAANSTFTWNTMDAFNALDAPAGAGSQGNAVLQTGTQNNNVGPVEWSHNWFDGGGYTIRGRKAEDAAYTADYTFRNNRFGRDFRYGPLQNAYYAGFDFDDSNVWDDTGLPVN